MNNLGRGSEDNKKKKERILTRETVGFVLVLFAAIALVILITRSLIFGSVGFAISSFLLGVFGYCAYAVLAALIYTGVVLITGKRITASGKTVLYCTLLFVFLVCLVHTITAEVSDIAYGSYGQYLGDCYRAGEANGTGGGVIFGLVVYPVVKLTTSVGGYIIFSLLMVGTAYLLYASRSAFQSAKKRREQTREKMIDDASTDTAGMYNLNYAEPQAQYQPQYQSQPELHVYPSETDTERAAREISMRTESGEERSRRLFSVSDEFELKSKRELRQDRRAAETAKRAEEPARPLSPYAQSRSILYPDRSGENYTNNLIFDSDSYFNRTDRGAISRQQYSDNFRPASIFEGHERTNRTEAEKRIAEEKAGKSSESSVNPGMSQTPSAASSSSASQQVPPKETGYTQFYSDETDGNVTYVNKPKKIVTDTTRATENTQDTAVQETKDFYRNDVHTEYSDARKEFSSAPDLSSGPSPAQPDRGRMSAPEPPKTTGLSEGRQDDVLPTDVARTSEIKEEPSAADLRSRGQVLRGEETSQRRQTEENIEKESTDGRITTGRGREETSSRGEREQSGGLRPADGIDSAVNLFDEDEDEEEPQVSSVPERMERTRPVAEPENLASSRRNAPAPQQNKAEAETPKTRHVYARYNPPPISLLRDYQNPEEADVAEIEHNKETIVDTLYQLKIPSEVLSVTQGPTVTRYDIDIPGNIPTTRVLSCDKEIAMRLHAKDGVNIQTNYENGSISIEVPNRQRAVVGLKEMILSDQFTRAKEGALMFGLGKDIEGKAICGDIAKMKHILVAGSTGAGKSVCLNALIISLLYKYSPEQLRIILVDPKQVEFNIYEKLPHLMVNEIINEPAKVVNVLNWLITEMERRYALFKEKTRTQTLVREIDEYNAHLLPDEERLPKIVLIIDELADLMLVAKKDLEDRIQRLTQKSRAAGIHLVLATQRPSVNVITGVIKSNLPTRIAFKVTQEVDSRTILDESGAEKLLGHGDMLYKTDTMTFPAREQGAFLASEEVQDVVDYVKEHNEAYFDESVSDYINNERSGGGAEGGGDGDDSVEAVYIDALRHVVSIGQASISMIQRRCSVGYPKAGKIIEWMENMGYISAFDGAKARKVLMTQEEFDSKYGDYGE